MSKQKRKFPATATPDKTRQDKPLVELSKEQLEAIAGGGFNDGCPMTECTNHNETMFVFAQLNFERDTACRAQQREKLKLLATPEKTRPEKPLVELTEEQLEAIAGGSSGCPYELCGINHNETMMSAA